MSKISYILLIIICSYFLYNTPLTEYKFNKEIFQTHRKFWGSSVEKINYRGIDLFSSWLNILLSSRCSTSVIVRDFFNIYFVVTSLNFGTLQQETVLQQTKLDGCQLIHWTALSDTHLFFHQMAIIPRPPYYLSFLFMWLSSHKEKKTNNFPCKCSIIEYSFHKASKSPITVIKISFM